jgi:hypothetical protein
MIFGRSQKTHKACKNSRLKLPNTLPVSRFGYMNLLNFCEKLYRNPDMYFVSLGHLHLRLLVLGKWAFGKRSFVIVGFGTLLYVTLKGSYKYKQKETLKTTLSHCVSLLKKDTLADPTYKSKIFKYVANKIYPGKTWVKFLKKCLYFSSTLVKDKL